MQRLLDIRNPDRASHTKRWDSEATLQPILINPDIPTVNVTSSIRRYYTLLLQSRP